MPNSFRWILIFNLFCRSYLVWEKLSQGNWSPKFWFLYKNFLDLIQFSATGWDGSWFEFQRLLDMNNLLIHVRGCSKVTKSLIYPVYEKCVVYFKYFIVMVWFLNKHPIENHPSLQHSFTQLYTFILLVVKRPKHTNGEKLEACYWCYNRRGKRERFLRARGYRENRGQMIEQLSWKYNSVRWHPVMTTNHTSDCHSELQSVHMKANSLIDESLESTRRMLALCEEVNC